MRKAVSSLAVIFTLILILAACRAITEPVSAIASSTPSPSPVYTDVPTAEPTATPFVPLTLEEIKAKLEDFLGGEAEYLPDTVIETDDYLFAYKYHYYFVDSQTGTIHTRFTNAFDYSLQEFLTDMEFTKVSAIDEIENQCPEFFEYDYYLESHRSSESLYSFFFYQLSEKGRRTGNHIMANVDCDGTIEHFYVSCYDDPEAVDADCAVSEENAIELAYQAVGEYTKENPINSEDSSYELLLDEIDMCRTSAYLTCFKGVQKWVIEIEDVKKLVVKEDPSQVKITYCYFINIDANTGEILLISHTSQVK